jgi:hypothetical protein
VGGGAAPASAQYAGAIARPMQPGLPPGMSVFFQQPATTYRWSDGDWILSVGVTITNTVGYPVMFSPTTFSAWSNGAPMSYWAPAATLRAPQVIAPGQTVSGTLAWYYNRAQPQPVTALVTSGGPGGLYRTSLPVMPGGGAAPVAQPVVMAPTGVTPGVRFMMQPYGTSFRWSDSDWIARVHVTIVNGTPMPVQIDPSQFDAVANGTPMTDWSSAATLQSTVTLMPGQSISGTVAWYYNSALPPPMAVNVSYRSAPWVRQVVVTPVAPNGHVPGAVR